MIDFDDDDMCFNIVNDLDDYDDTMNDDDVWNAETYFNFPTPKTKVIVPKNMVPTTLMVAQTIQRNESKRVF